MKNSDAVIGPMIVILCIVGFFYTHSLNLQSMVGLSPAAFPKWLFGLMAICGVFIFLESRKLAVHTPASFRWKTLLGTILLLIVYAYAFEYVGFIISTIVFLVLALYLFEEKRPKILISVPLVASFTIYYLFTEFFLIPLP